MNNDAIDTLRAMYRSARAGAALDVPAYVDALLDAIADGHELHKIEGCFEKVGYHTRLDIIGHTEGGAARLLRARERGGWKGALRVASALGLADEWAAAMTAYYGPTGLHESRLGEDGTPTAATLCEFPCVAEAMANAAARFDRLVAWHAERYAGQVPEMRYVVRHDPPVKVA